MYNKGQKVTIVEREFDNKSNRAKVTKLDVGHVVSLTTHGANVSHNDPSHRNPPEWFPFAALRPFAN